MYLHTATYSQWTKAWFTLVTLLSWLQDGRPERRRSEYTDAFLVRFLCGVFTWSRFIDKMSPRKVYSFCCLLFSLTGAITIIRSVQRHFLVTQIPSVSQMLLAIALQRLLLREWVKMSCFLSLLSLHSSVLSQEKHSLHLAQIICSSSFLGSTEDITKCPSSSLI